MEFPFEVDTIFPENISLVDNRLIPGASPRGGSPTNFHIRGSKQHLTEIIDKMGYMSAKAQRLKGPITSSDKLEFSDHHLYVMKDDDPNSSHSIAGILKVGHKNLFLYNNEGIQCEMKPLSVLDFYVHESRQRAGYGQRLFEYMLKEEDVCAKHIAYDRPSNKFVNFLYKYYNLNVSIPQVNNFLIFDGFFRNSKGSSSTQEGGNKKPPVHPYRHIESRSSAVGNRQLSAGWRNIEKNKQALNHVKVERESSFDRPSSGQSLSSTGGQRVGTSAGFSPKRALIAKINMYSRHATEEDTSGSAAPIPQSLKKPAQQDSHPNYMDRYSKELLASQATPTKNATWTPGGYVPAGGSLVSPHSYKKFQHTRLW